MKKVRLVKVNTTAFEEEDFLLFTTLTDKQIIKGVKPVVDEERNGGEYYDNDALVLALKELFPNETIEQHQIDGLDKVSI